MHILFYRGGRQLKCIFERKLEKLYYLIYLCEFGVYDNKYHDVLLNGSVSNFFLEGYYRPHSPLRWLASLAKDQHDYFRIEVFVLPLPS